jgi:hypothetical protein
LDLLFLEAQCIPQLASAFVVFVGFGDFPLPLACAHVPGALGLGAGARWGPWWVVGGGWWGWGWRGWGPCGFGVVCNWVRLKPAPNIIEFESLFYLKDCRSDWLG